VYHKSIAYKNNSENHRGKEQKNMKNGYKLCFCIQNSDIVASRSKQPIFFLESLWELQNMFLGHFAPLILYTEENPLKPPHYLKNSNGKYSQVIMSKMRGELVSPCAAKNQITSYDPIVNLTKEKCQSIGQT
jgi:hypothetical protein